MHHKLIMDNIKGIEEILGEGKQVKNIIEAKYGSLKAFHQKENLSISLKVLMNYCSSEKLPSKSFKCKLVTIFNQDLDDIIVPKHKQVKHRVKQYIYEIYNNIVVYNDISDLDTFEKIIKICNKLDLICELSIMYRNVAKNYYYRSDNKKTIMLYHDAILLINNNDFDIMVILHTELADHYYIEGNLIECENHFKIAFDIINHKHIGHAALYKYYYRRGIILQIEGLYTEARELLEKSMQYAHLKTDSTSEKGAALLALGTTYKRNLNYEEAKNQYFKALFEFHTDDIYGKSSTLNNIADIYCILKDYKTAIKYIEDAISLIEKEGITDRYLILKQTFAEIKLLIGDTSYCYIFFDELRKTVNTSIDKKIIKNRIIDMINLINDKDLLEYLRKTIYYLKSHTDNDSYIEILYFCIGRVDEKLEIIKI